MLGRKNPIVIFVPNALEDVLTVPAHRQAEEALNRLLVRFLWLGHEASLRSS